MRTNSPAFNPDFRALSSQVTTKTGLSSLLLIKATTAPAPKRFLISSATVRKSSPETPSESWAKTTLLLPICSALSASGLTKFKASLLFAPEISRSMLLTRSSSALIRSGNSSDLVDFTISPTRFKMACSFA